MRALILNVTACVALVAAMPAGGDDAAPLRPGDRFPIVSLPSLADGAPLSVARFRGRKILLHQFASW